jgi:hypothetical protein
MPRATLFSESRVGPHTKGGDGHGLLFRGRPAVTAHSYSVFHVSPKARLIFSAPQHRKSLVVSPVYLRERASHIGDKVSPCSRSRPIALFTFTFMARSHRSVLLVVLTDSSLRSHWSCSSRLNTRCASQHSSVSQSDAEPDRRDSVRLMLYLPGGLTARCPSLFASRSMMRCENVRLQAHTDWLRWSRPRERVKCSQWNSIQPSVPYIFVIDDSLVSA